MSQAGVAVFGAALTILAAACSTSPPSLRPAQSAPNEAPSREAEAAAEASGAPAASEESDERPADREVPPPVRIAVEHQDRIDAVIEAAIRGSAMPGCVVVIGRRAGVLFRRAYGDRSIVPSRAPMTIDTVFDLASVTKPVATTTALAILEERGRVDLDAPVSRFIPELARGAKRGMTVRHLLTHTSGLPAVDSLRNYDGGREAALARLLALELESPPGTRYVYSDLGFILLGEIVERAAGTDLATFTRENVFERLGMRETAFRPTGALRDRAAPTERTEHRPGVDVIHGEAHDPRAYRLGGVAGNAGLFSTADDLARFARMMLGEGELDGVRVLSPESVRRITTAERLPNGGHHALGWDAPSSRQRQHGWSPRAYGHGGFTGTSIWIDPERDTFVVFLSNRVHPDGTGNVLELIRTVGELGLAAADGATPPAGDATVLTGVDVLRRDAFRQLRGARVGLVTNVSGRARDGMRTVDLLARSPDVELVALFSPEHGLDGNREGHVRGGRDPRTGLAVHSLFGPNRDPSAESLEGVDTLVFDLQDVGTRFYTYMSTMRRVMEAAARRDIRFVVLDRPNPIGGDVVEGPILEAGRESFVNHHPLPVRHGMTAGELARLIDHERRIGARIEVVPVEGWSRAKRWDETGLLWVPPSPNLKTPLQALLYPAVGLLESTNVSVGRGTAVPFEVIGAPWMRPPAMIEALARSALAGVRFEETRFVPRVGPYRGQVCRGVRVEITDARAFRAVPTALALARALFDVHPREWESEDLDRMLGHGGAYEALRQGRAPADLEPILRADAERFEERRRRFLLYR